MIVDNISIDSLNNYVNEIEKKKKEELEMAER